MKIKKGEEFPEGFYLCDNRHLAGPYNEDQMKRAKAYYAANSIEVEFCSEEEIEMHAEECWKEDPNYVEVVEPPREKEML